MRTGIHPKWNEAADVSCACGNMFTVGASQDTIKVEICAKCHPFFTGEMKFVDTLGRVEKFQKKQKLAASVAVVMAEKKKKKADREAQLRSPKSLKDMLMGLK